jgi:phospholipase/carboxylesterase
MSQKLQHIEYKKENSKIALVLLHGYGANAQDLAPLSSFFEFRKPLSSFFPQAPHVPAELAAFGGRAWFNLNMMLLQQRALSPEGPLYDAAHVEKLKKTCDAYLAPYLDELSQQYEHIVLGGFSQGAMLALDWAWRHYQPYLKALVLYSGAWPYLEAPSECRIPAGLPIFVSHGQNDPILRFRHSEQMVAELEKKKAFVVPHYFGGVHEIPSAIIANSKKFLEGFVNS